MIVAQSATALNRYTTISRFQTSAVNDPQSHDEALLWMGAHAFWDDEDRVCRRRVLRAIVVESACLAEQRCAQPS
jgi:hypothetical protein